MTTASCWCAFVVCGFAVAAPQQKAAPPAATDAASLFAQYASGRFDEWGRGVENIRDWSAFVKSAKRDRRNWPPKQAAGFLLEASCAAIEDREPHVPQLVDTDLLKIAEDAVRAPGIAPEFGRLWHLAVIACRERATFIEFPVPAGSSPEWPKLLRQITTLMPDEPGIALANVRQQEREFSFWLGNGAVKAANPNPTSFWERRAAPEARKLMIELSDQFAHLTDTPAVAAEAAVRAGFWRMMAGDQDQALTLFEKGARAASADADHRYAFLAALFSGRALAILKRHDEAIASLRQALAIWPTADSPRSLLAAELYTNGARDEAARVVTTMLSAPSSNDDPWRAFPLGDGYLWPERRAELRRALVTK